MYTLYKFHFLNGISEINQLFDDILIIWPAPVHIIYYIYYVTDHSKVTVVVFVCSSSTVLQGALYDFLR